MALRALIDIILQNKPDINFLVTSGTNNLLNFFPKIYPQIQHINSYHLMCTNSEGVSYHDGNPI